MVSRVRINELLCQAEVDQVDEAGPPLAATTDAAVLGLDVAVNHAVGVDVLDAVQELQGKRNICVCISGFAQLSLAIYRITVVQDVSAKMIFLAISKNQ